MKLNLNGLDVDCVIGELPDERNRLQRLRVNVGLEIPDRAAETDALDDTVDYAALAARIREALVAAAVATVTKSGAVPGLESASAVYSETREAR